MFSSCLIECFLFQNLKHLLKAVTLENLISHRSLLHEGKLVLTGAYSWHRSNTASVQSASVWAISYTIFLWFITREHQADRCLPVPVWRISADHKDKEKQEGKSRCSQSDPDHGRYSVVRMYRSSITSSYCVVTSCVAVDRSGVESSEAAAEPGAGSAAEGGMHLHGSGPARLSGPTPAQEHWSAQCLK